METTTITKPTIRTFLVADLKCYLCGAIYGTIEGERQPMPRVACVRRAGEAHASQVPDWRSLRCARCNGPLFLDEAHVVTRRFEEYNWLEERPRRGRPPKRLLDERRDRERLGSQAA